jgi:23S rRNA pseudouridine1911/1915/1917 synthase
MTIGSSGGSSGDETETFTTEVPALLAGVRLDRVVAMLANVSRAAAADLVESGRVLVDGAEARVGRAPVEEGSQLDVLLPVRSPVEVKAEPEVSFQIVYADDVVVVVDKPAGLVVHPGAGHGQGTLVGGLLARFPDLSDLVASGVCAPDRPGIVHRLDKGTSGLLAVARTAEAYRALVAQLARRTIERRYLALVTGDVEAEQGEVDAPIGRSARTPTKMAVAASGKPARTAYSVKQRRDGSTLLEVSLQSGRTHQIRVHMAAIGHPVVGDARYGKPEPLLGPERFFLHAYRLAFDHPVSGEHLDLTTPLPSDLSEYLEQTLGPTTAP